MYAFNAAPVRPSPAASLSHPVQPARRAALTFLPPQPALPACHNSVLLQLSYWQTTALQGWAPPPAHFSQHPPLNAPQLSHTRHECAQWLQTGGGPGGHRPQALMHRTTQPALPGVASFGWWLCRKNHCSGQSLLQPMPLALQHGMTAG